MGNSNMYASVSDMKSLLLDNWSLSTTPDITFTWEEKSTGFMDDRRDFVLLTPTMRNLHILGCMVRIFYTKFMLKWTYIHIKILNIMKI